MLPYCRCTATVFRNPAERTQQKNDFTLLAQMKRFSRTLTATEEVPKNQRILEDSANDNQCDQSVLLPGTKIGPFVS